MTQLSTYSNLRAGWLGTNWLPFSLSASVFCFCKLFYVEETDEMNTSLEIKEVTKRFNKKTALFPFSLTAGEGECIALCGGNGAGKSTLLHIIAGISTPSSWYCCR